MTFFAYATVRQRLMMLLGLCFMACALPSLMLLSNYAEDIRKASRMAAGVEPARNMLQVIRLAQQHRGLTALWLGGDESAAERRAAKKMEVDAAVNALTLRLRADNAPNSRLSKAYERLADTWVKLEARVATKQLDATQSGVEHTRLIAGMLDAMDELADHWELSFAPVPSIYFMVIASLRDAPSMIELMGQTRASCARLLTSKEGISAVDRAHFSSFPNPHAAELQRHVAHAGQVRGG